MGKCKRELKTRQAHFPKLEMRLSLILIVKKNNYRLGNSNHKRPKLLIRRASCKPIWPMPQ